MVLTGYSWGTQEHSRGTQGYSRGRTRFSEELKGYPDWYSGFLLVLWYSGGTLRHPQTHTHNPHTNTLARRHACDQFGPMNVSLSIFLLLNHCISIHLLNCCIVSGLPFAVNMPRSRCPDVHAHTGADVHVRACLHASYHARCGLTGTLWPHRRACTVAHHGTCAHAYSHARITLSCSRHGRAC